MSKKVEYKAQVTIVGKEFSPKREEMIINEKKVPAKDDTFNLYVMFGTMRDDIPELYDTQPTVLTVEVSKTDYLKVNKRETLNALIRQDNTKTSVRELDGIPVIVRKEDVDEDLLFAKEKAELERMQAQSGKK